MCNKVTFRFLLRVVIILVLLLLLPVDTFLFWHKSNTVTNSRRIIIIKNDDRPTTRINNLIVGKSDGNNAHSFSFFLFRRRHHNKVLTSIGMNDSQHDQQHEKNINTNDDDDNNNSNNSNNKRPLFSIGLIADIQYAPIDDGYSYSGNARYYRNSLIATKYAAQHFEQENVICVINLGDIVDGKCITESSRIKGKTETAIDCLINDNEESDEESQAVNHVLDALGIYQNGPIIHTYGNHCLYNMDRFMIGNKLNIPFTKEPCGEDVGYYTFQLPTTNYRCIVLDSYDISLMQRCEINSNKRKQALEILKVNNPINFVTENFNSPDGLEGLQRRFVAFNGAVGTIQLQWLEETLHNARSNNEKVIILSHQPIHPQSTKPICLIWNYQDVIDILHNYNDIVIAAFAGHAHQGGYHYCNDHNIHYRVIEAVLENIPPSYAIVDIYEHQLHIRGYGNCESAILPITRTYQSKI